MPRPAWQRNIPSVRVIILSMNAAEEYVLQALRAGAVGYLLKNVSPSELALALKAVSRGETFLSSAVSKSMEDYVFHHRGKSQFARAINNAAT